MRDRAPEVWAWLTLGPERADPDGRTLADLFADGRWVGEVVYTAAVDHLMILEVRAAPDAPPGLGGSAVQALLARHGGSPRVAHHGVLDATTLRAWQAHPLAPGCVVAGYYGRRAMTYDPIALHDFSTAPEVVHAGHPAAQVSVVFDPVLRSVGGPDVPTPAAVWRWLRSDPYPVPLVAVRRLVLDPGVPTSLAWSGHLLALLHPVAAVRQTAALHLSGVTGDAHVEVAPGSWEGFFARPWSIADAFGEVPPDGPASERAVARRNARYAVLWALANLCHAAGAPDSPAWVRAVVASARAGLAAAACHDPERDAWRLGLALDELHPDPDRHFAFGVDEDVTLYDLLRFSALRWGVLGRLRLRSQDRYHWLVDNAAVVAGEDSAWQRDLPDLPQLAERAELPEWLFGPNHLPPDA